MPRSRRDVIKLKHEQTLAAIEKAVGYMDELHDAFREHHPEYAAGYANICEVLVQAHEFVARMESFI